MHSRYRQLKKPTIGKLRYPVSIITAVCYHCGETCRRGFRSALIISGCERYILVMLTGSPGPMRHGTTCLLMGLWKRMLRLPTAIRCENRVRVVASQRRGLATKGRVCGPSFCEELPNRVNFFNENLRFNMLFGARFSTEACSRKSCYSLLMGPIRAASLTSSEWPRSHI